MKEVIENKLGFWFIDEKEYSGMLSFSQDDGIHVTIISTDMKLGLNNLESFPIITGVTENGEPITLVNCKVFNSNMSMRNIGEGFSTCVEKAIIRAEYMLEGMFFDSIEDIKFRFLMGSYTDLDEWVDLSGFNIQRTDNEKDDFDYLIKYKSPKPIIFKINPETSVGIGFSIHGPKQSIVQKEAKIQQTCHLIVQGLNNPIELSELMKYIRWFSLLLQIGSQRLTYPIEITGKIDKSDKPNLVQSQYVQIYFQPIEASRELGYLIPPEFLFTFNDLDEGIIKTWFNNYSTLRVMVNMRSTLFLHDRQFLENKFLDILQALETLHSMRFKSRCIDKPNFDELREKILSCLTKKYRKIFAQRIGNLNYLSLQDKLSELIRNREVLFSKAICNIDGICKRIIRTRNLIVHASSSKKPLTTREMVYVIELLKLLFDSYLLEKIGFSKEKYIPMIQKKIDEYLKWGIVFNK